METQKTTEIISHLEENNNIAGLENLIKQAQEAIQRLEKKAQNISESYSKRNEISQVENLGGSKEELQNITSPFDKKIEQEDAQIVNTVIKAKKEINILAEDNGNTTSNFETQETSSRYYTIGESNELIPDSDSGILEITPEGNIKLEKDKIASNEDFKTFEKLYDSNHRFAQWGTIEVLKQPDFEKTEDGFRLIRKGFAQILTDFDIKERARNKDKIISQDIDIDKSVGVENEFSNFNGSAKGYLNPFIGKLEIGSGIHREDFIVEGKGNGFVEVKPFISRFSTKSEFLLYYKNQFDLDNPRGGNVRVLKPAIFKQTGKNEFEFVEKGKLEIYHEDQ